MEEATVLEALTNVLKNLEPWWDTTHLLAYVIGFALIIWSIVQLATLDTGSKMMQGNQGKFAKLIGGFVGGIFLLNLPKFLDTVSESFFKKGSMHGLSFAEVKVTGDMGIYIKFSLAIVVLVGLFSVIKGCVMLKNSMENPEIFWQSVTHIGGGTLAINSVQFIKMIGESLGHTVNGQISNIFY